jgi:hypothetical protein
LKLFLTALFEAQAHCRAATQPVNSVLNARWKQMAGRRHQCLYVGADASEKALHRGKEVAGFWTRAIRSRIAEATRSGSSRWR